MRSFQTARVAFRPAVALCVSMRCPRTPTEARASINGSLRPPPDTLSERSAQPTCESDPEIVRCATMRGSPPTPAPSSHGMVSWSAMRRRDKVNTTCAAFVNGEMEASFWRGEGRRRERAHITDPINTIYGVYMGIRVLSSVYHIYTDHAAPWWGERNSVDVFQR